MKCKLYCVRAGSALTIARGIPGGHLASDARPHPGAGRGGASADLGLAGQVLHPSCFELLPVCKPSVLGERRWV